MEGWYKESPIIVDALITYPAGEGPFPLLLIVHSSGGADEFTANWLEFMRDQQKPLLDMGIATMYLDNFSARGAKHTYTCLLYTSPSPRDKRQSRMPSSA